jgi:GntR family transcriptional regulator, transcriptional repressor for pyruvate dehydrogenase complex
MMGQVWLPALSPAIESNRGSTVVASSSSEFRPFTPAEPQRAFDIIVRQMRDRLKSGELRPGDRLPGERELVEHFQVSRNTIREAVRMMEVTGLIEVKRGATGGMFIADGDPAMVTRSISDMMSLTTFSLNDLLEVRLWIGSTTARVACERATEEDLDVLEANVDQAQSYGEAGEWERRSEVNHEFQNLLAAACHNPLLLMVQHSITDVVSEIVAAAGPIQDDWLLESKRKLVSYIRARDPDGAAQQMESHLKMVSAVWMQVLSEPSPAEPSPAPPAPRAARKRTRQLEETT